MDIRVGPADGEWLSGGAVIKVRGEEIGGALAVVETVLPPKALISQHVHANDVWIYLLAGEVGVPVGEEIAHGGPGTWLLKPRNMPHAMWNATRLSARVMEVLTSAGLEGYFIDGQSMPDQAHSTRWPRLRHSFFPRLAVERAFAEPVRVVVRTTADTERISGWPE